MVIYDGPSRRERRKRETRARILAAGASRFASNGFDACTIDDIAAAADVGKGTIYNYFPAKEDILVAFMIDVERDVQRDVARIIRTRGTLDAILTRFVLRQFERKAPHHAFVRVFLAHLCASTTAESAWVREVQTVVDPPLGELFAALARRGLLRRDVDLDVAIQAFKVMQLGLTVVWAMEGPPWTQIPGIVRTQVRLLCSGLEARS